MPQKRYLRYEDYRYEFTGCCKPVITQCVFEAFMNLILFVNGLAALIIATEIIDEVDKYKDDPDCDDYIIDNVSEHALTVQAISAGMMAWSIIAFIFMCILWVYINNQLEYANDRKMQEEFTGVYRAVLYPHRILYWMDLLVFVGSECALFSAGYRYWRDAEDADNEQCVREDKNSNLDPLTDQLKYTLVPCFVVGCVALLCIVGAMCCCALKNRKERNMGHG